MLFWSYIFLSSKNIAAAWHMPENMATNNEECTILSRLLGFHVNQTDIKRLASFAYTRVYAHR